MKLINKIDNLQNTKFDFVKNFFKFGIASLVIIVVGLFVWLFAGFNLGLDFTGGSIVKIKFGEVLEQNGKYDQYVDKIENIFDKHGISLSQIQKEGVDADASIAVRFQDKPSLSEEEMSNLVNGEIKAELIATFSPNGEIPSFDVYEGQKIGATASSELLMNAILSIIIASVLLLIYIAVRFKFANGVATLLGIVHDVLIVLALMAIFRVEINSAFIAAIITVIGYSINNTIIVFDRIRENQRNDLYAKENNATIVNISIRQTLIRSIYTSLTTFIAVIALVILGVDSIRIFLVPIIIGLLAGTYSSIFLAAPMWELMLRRLAQRKKAEAEIRKLTGKSPKTSVFNRNANINELNEVTSKSTNATDANNKPVDVEVIEN